MKPKSLLALALLLSGVGDVCGGLLAVLDWRRAAAFLHAIPDWEPQRRAARAGLVDDALHQLWANLGTALIALGCAQLLAAYWVSRERKAGFDLARVIGWSLLGAGAMMAVTVPQLSSLLTEALRGLVILALAVWARTALEAAAPAKDS